MDQAEVAAVQVFMPGIAAVGAGCAGGGAGLQGIDGVRAAGQGLIGSSTMVTNMLTCGDIVSY
jgi:hypothetical protein